MPSLHDVMLCAGKSYSNLTIPNALKPQAHPKEQEKYRPIFSFSILLFFCSSAHKIGLCTVVCAVFLYLLSLTSFHPKTKDLD